jgi:hypothetical protein
MAGAVKGGLCCSARFRSVRWGTKEVEKRASSWGCCAGWLHFCRQTQRREPNAADNDRAPRIKASKISERRCGEPANRRPVHSHRAPTVIPTHRVQGLPSSSAPKTFTERYSKVLSVRSRYTASHILAEFVLKYLTICETTLCSLQ